MYKERIHLYREIEELRKTKLLVYITGDRPGLETQIHEEVGEFFLDHLDTFSLPPKISLFIYSRGGAISAAWTLVNMLRLFCDEFEVIIPYKAQSAATLIALGADKIIMTKQAFLGPIDPSINSPLNPQLPWGTPEKRVPISVEAVAGFFEYAKNELHINSQENLTEIYLKLADFIHPISTGSIFRSRTQIQRLAEKLLKIHLKDEKQIQKIIAILCSESGSHDYTINRREALNDLKLPIEKPDDKLYNIIKAIYKDIRSELEIDVPFSPAFIINKSGGNTANFKARRTLVESITGGSHCFISEGTINKITNIQPNQFDDKNFIKVNYEGWNHEQPESAS